MGQQSCNSIYLLIPLWRARIHGLGLVTIFFFHQRRDSSHYDTIQSTGTYIVNNILLRVLVIRSRLVHRTYYVHLIVLERRVVLVHVYYMVCVVYSKSVTEKRMIVNNE